MAAEPAKNQSPANVIVDINRKTVSGTAKGTYATITPQQELSNAEPGSDGSVVVTDIPQSLAVLKVALQPTSDSNDTLEDALATGKFFAVSVRDLEGRLVCTTPQGKVKKRAEVKYADTVQSVEWEIWLIQPKYEVRGSRAAL